jgi:hypothetical protein
MSDADMLTSTRLAASAGDPDNAMSPATRTITQPMSSTAKRMANVALPIYSTRSWTDDSHVRDGITMSDKMNTFSSAGESRP